MNISVGIKLCYGSFHVLVTLSANLKIISHLPFIKYCDSFLTQAFTFAEQIITCNELYKTLIRINSIYSQVTYGS
jgi:hypothetical protein